MVAASLGHRGSCQESLWLGSKVLGAVGDGMYLGAAAASVLPKGAPLVGGLPAGARTYWGGQWALGLLFSPDPWDPLWGSRRACGLLCVEGTLPILNAGEGPSLPEWEERKQHSVALLGGSAVSGGPGLLW